MKRVKSVVIYGLGLYVRESADKFLARTGRKKTTATKLGIYSTYSARTSKHILARCSNFCKPLKKKIRLLSVQPGLRGSNDLRVGRKMANFHRFLAQGTGGSATGSDLDDQGCVIKTMEAQVGQFRLGCKCPVSRGTVVQKQDSLGELPATFFFQNVLSIRYVAVKATTITSKLVTTP